MLFILSFGCSKPGRISDPNEFHFDYFVSTYSGDTTSKNLREIDFYDSTGLLLRHRETSGGCTQLFYGPNGKLTEKRYSRNCLGGWRELMIYDKKGNLLGTYTTKDTLVNLDTISYKQTFFYDGANRLVRERTREWRNSNDSTSEQWNCYFLEIYLKNF